MDLELFENSADWESDWNSDWNFQYLKWSINNDIFL